MHPAEFLRYELDELELPANVLSKGLETQVNRVTVILNDQRGVVPDTARRRARHFGTTPVLWLNPQKTRALRKPEIAAGHEVVKRVKPKQSAATGSLADAHS